MSRDAWWYQGQENNGDEPDHEKGPWIHPEEIPEDDSDDDEEMDEM